ncbi:MAG: DUF58 domain-containing protein [Planctomycetes bacterium]|nr:DUF58 domain-containing protein [Planctomycetota bacterium]
MIVGAAQNQRPIPTTIEQLLPVELSSRLDRLDLLSRKILSGKLPGERRSKRRGRSVEFDDFRDYVAGDDLRHIDWNIYARLDRLFIKLFREEEDLALHLIVDATPSMSVGNPSKLVFSHQLAMALAYIGLVNQNRVCVGTFSHPSPNTPLLRQLTPLRGRVGLGRVGAFLLESLGNASARGAGATFDPAATFSRVMLEASHARSGRGIMVVLSDFLIPGGCDTGLAYLGTATMSGAFDTYCVQILSPAELDPAREQAAGLFGDLRLTDAESGRSAEVTVTPESVAIYKRNFAAYQEQLHVACTFRGMAHSVVPSDTPIDRLILNTLRRGGLFR